MTRSHTRKPAWTWFCDRCGTSSGDLAFDQHRLPTPDDMRARGWFIADTYGDLCAGCNTTPRETDEMPEEGDQ